MVRLELTPAEARVLHEILRSYLSDLRMEIAQTDSWEFRQGLKQQEDFIKRLLNRLEAPESETAGSHR